MANSKLIPMFFLGFLAACDGNPAESASELAVGLETSNGIETLAIANDISIYPGDVDGHAAYIWLGNNLPAVCLDGSSANDCLLNVTLDLGERTVNSRALSVTGPDSPIEGWRRRIYAPLSFAPEMDPPFGKRITLELSLTIDKSPTLHEVVALTLREGFYNPE